MNCSFRAHNVFLFEQKLSFLLKIAIELLVNQKKNEPENFPHISPAEGQKSTGKSVL